MSVNDLRNQFRVQKRAVRNGVSLSAALVTLLAAGTQAQTPRPAPAYEDKIVVELAGDFPGRNPTQMVWGPGGRLYVMNNNDGVFSYRYNPVTGKLSDEKQVVFGIAGIGIAFHTDRQGRTTMYLTAYDPTNDPNNNHDASGMIVRLRDENGNGVWGETGETRVNLVTKIPTSDHAVDQLLVQGDTLYVGIGVRTINGRTGMFTSGNSDDYGDLGFWHWNSVAGRLGNGQTFGECALGGTICYIEDLNAVADTTDSANPYGVNPTRNQAFYQQNALPYTIEKTLNPQTLKGKLRIYLAGTRNPFGMAFDKSGDLWFTVNFNRVETNGDGTAGFGYRNDSLDNADFSKDVYDQVFKAVKGGDYGYSNENWRGKATTFLGNDPSKWQRSVTRDQLWDKLYTLHDPANPDGMGPHASADGCAFFEAPGLPAELQNNLFVTRYSSQLKDKFGRVLDYRDVVAVDVTTSPAKARRVAQDFNAPVCALTDTAGRLIIGDLWVGKFYILRPAAQKMTVTATPTRSGANLTARVTLANTGDLTMNGVTITGAKLAGKGTTTAIPVSVGTINKNQSADVNLRFPYDGASGAKLVLTVSGSYNGGNFSVSQRVTAP